MEETPGQVDVYLEVGEKRTFAGAIEWPGWCRSGKDETSALRALLESGHRYARVVGSRQLAFSPPAEISSLVVVERLEGGSGTDFGAPGAVPSSDGRPVEPQDLKRLLSVLESCWQAFDAAVEAAAGRELRKGPRGGGRDTESIVDHVLGAHLAYLSRLGWSYRQDDQVDISETMVQIRQETIRAIEASLEGTIPAVGPRGGARWSARYFVRRAAWHVLDHAWEIEDRVQSA